MTLPPLSPRLSAQLAHHRPLSLELPTRAVRGRAGRGAHGQLSLSLPEPGAVGHLSFTEILDTSLKVSWQEPLEKNGVVTGKRPPPPPAPNRGRGRRARAPAVCGRGRGPIRSPRRPLPCGPRPSGAVSRPGPGLGAQSLSLLPPPLRATSQPFPGEFSPCVDHPTFSQQHSHRWCDGCADEQTGFSLRSANARQCLCGPAATATLPRQGPSPVPQPAGGRPGQGGVRETPG